MDPCIACLESWIGHRADAAARSWLQERLAVLGNGPTARSLGLAVSGASRRFPHRSLQLTDEELAAAQVALPGWQPVTADLSMAARWRLLLSLRVLPAAQGVSVLEDLITTADSAEQVAVFGVLSLLPWSTALVPVARQGLRSNAAPVFAAVALDNPFPADVLPEAAWNQMILKAFFIGVDVRRVHDVDSRHNPALARMLGQYARERWAAGRAIAPQLWRFIAPHADADRLADLQRALASGPSEQRAAAALALRSCHHPEAARLLAASDVRPAAGWDAVPGTV